VLAEAAGELYVFGSSRSSRSEPFVKRPDSIERLA
jgi:hypothetical protein